MNTFVNNGRQGVWDKERAGVIVGIGLVLVTIVSLVPYTAGYGYVRVTIGHFLDWMWTHQEDWEHGAFVPWVAVGLVYLRRAHLATLPVRGHWMGGLAVVLSGVLYWLGYRAEQQYLAFASIQLLVAGLIVWFLGWAFMRALFFPWLFLVFMWPLPFLESVVAFPLRLIMSQLAYGFLNVVGLPTLKVGSAVVSAPDPELGLAQGARFAVDIADPCSGIRSLFALAMIAALYGYVAFRETWKRVVIFLAAVPLAVLGNLCRILMLTFGTLVLGSDVAIGSLEHPTTFHMAAGFLVFGAAIGGMIGLGWVLRRPWSKIPWLERLDERLESLDRLDGSAPTILRARFPVWRSGAVLAVWSVVLLLCFTSPPVESGRIAGVVMDLPYRVGPYWGLDEKVSEAELAILPKDTEFARKTYESGTGDRILCSIVLAGAMKSSIHRPEVCLPGQGWSIVDSQVLPVELAGGRVLQVTNLTLGRDVALPDGTTRRIYSQYMYWFVGRGRSTPSHYDRILHTNWDLIANRINHRWAYVIVSSQVTEGWQPGGKNREQTIAMLKDFIAKIAPQFQVDLMPPERREAVRGKIPGMEAPEPEATP